MKVLLCNTMAPPEVVGGAEIAVEGLSMELSRQGHQVRFVSTSVDEKLSADGSLERQTIRHHNLYSAFDESQRARPTYQRLAWHARDTWNAAIGRRFGDILESFAPDVVHTHNIAGLSPSIWRVSQAHGIPVVHTLHDYHLGCLRASLLRSTGTLCENPPPPCKMLRGFYVRQAQQRIAALAAPSQFILDIHRRWGLNPPISRVIRNSVEDGCEVADAPDASDRSPRVVYIGQLVSHKGVRTLLRAWEAVIAAIPSARLEIAGTGPLTDEVRDSAKRMPSITFHGFVAPVERGIMLTRASLFVCPSEWYENAPLAVLEALSMGVPVVASSIGGLPEMVCAGQTGWIFDPGDADDLSRTLLEALSSHEKLISMGAEGRQASRAYSLQQHATSYVHLYRDVLARQGRDSGA